MNLLIVFTIKRRMQLQVRIKTRRARPPSFQLLRVCIDPVCKPGENEKIKQNSILPLLQTTVKKVFWSRPLAGSYRIRFRGWSATASCRAHGGPGQGALHKTERRDSLSVKSEELRSSTFPLNELCLTSLLGALLPHPPPARFPPLCLHCMGMPTPVGWRCSLYRPHHLSLPLPDPLSNSLSLTHSRICKNTVNVDAGSVWKIWSAESWVFPTFDDNLRKTSKPLKVRWLQGASESPAASPLTALWCVSWPLFCCTG